MGLEDLLQERLDAARVAVFDLLQAFQAAAKFKTVVVYRLSHGESLLVEALAESPADSATSRSLSLGESVPVSGSLEEDVIALRSSIIVPDTAADSHYRDRSAALGIRAYIGFPLVRLAGGLYGVISAYDPSPQPVPKSVVSVAKIVAKAVAYELETAAAIEAVLEGKADPWEALHAIGSIAPFAYRNASSEESEAVANATKIIAASFGFDLKSPPQRPSGASVDTAAAEAPRTRNEWPARVDDVVTRAGRLLPSLPGVRIDVQPGSGSAVDLDLRTLERIVANLLLNAWRSSPPGTPISVASLSVGDWVEISVEDKSGLVPVESIARRMHPAGSRRIGLPIAKALVEDAGGRLSQVATEDGRRYIVRLPVLRENGTVKNGPGGKGHSVRGA